MASAQPLKPRDQTGEPSGLDQPDENGLYNMSDDPGTSSLNLLHVRRMFKFTEPFSVSRLIKISDGKPLATNRTRGGGHSYVRIARDTAT